MESATNSHKPPVHIAILPAPGIGHLTPLLDLSRRLININAYTFSFTFILVPTTSSSEKSNNLSKTQTSFLSTLNNPHITHPQVNFISLPPPKFSNDEFPDVREQISAKVFLAVKRSLSSLRTLLINLLSSSNKEIQPPISSLVVDMFTTDAIGLALELGIEPYLCFQSSAMALRVYTHLPEMDRTVSCEFGDMAEPVIKLPGCVPLRGKDLPNPALDRKSVRYRWFLDHTKRFGLAKGIILNSFDALEEGSLRELRGGGGVDGGNPAIYPVGPLTKSSLETLVAVNARREEDCRQAVVVDNRDDNNKCCCCLKWLDQQPSESVLYVSFGSGGTLSTKQINEIASGLEMSGQRFLWVVRAPNDNLACGSYLGIHQDHNPLHYLPEGFIERTVDVGRGFVVPNWAPQVPILSHGAVGGFLTHCGWNSILESVVSGIPCIAWPLYAEQCMNAVFLEEDLKVAVRVRPDDDEDGLVRCEQIARLVNAVMTSEEGKVMGRKMKAMKVEAGMAVAENGSSDVGLRDLATKLSGLC